GPQAAAGLEGAGLRKRHGRHAAARALPSIWRGRQEAAQGGHRARAQSGRQLHHVPRDGGRIAHGSRAGRRADEALGRAGAHASSALGRVTGIALIVETAMDSLTITSWMREIDASMRLERDHLVQLDAAIGDGDHGTNMVRGFDAVVQALTESGAAPPGKLLILTGRTLVNTVGGASGPLWGSARRSGGRGLGDEP